MLWKCCVEKGRVRRVVPISIQIVQQLNQITNVLKLSLFYFVGQGQKCESESRG